MQVNLCLLKKDGSVKPFHLPSTVTVIGRRQDCDLCIPLSIASRKHCEINLDKGHAAIRDLGSKNGTYVNGQHVEEARLNPGDQVRIGPIVFVVQIDGQPNDVTGVKPIEPAHVPFLEGDLDKPSTPDTFIENTDLSSSQTTEITDFSGSVKLTDM